MDLNEQACPCDGKLKTTPGVSECSPSTGPTSPDMATSSKSIGTRSSRLTSCVEGSLANRLVLQENEKVLTTTAISGLKLSAVLALSGPLGSLVRMCLASSRWHSIRCVLTWKLSATPSSRSVYRLVPSMPPIRDRECGSWPTPDARDCHAEGFEAGKRRLEKYGTVGLQTAVKMWPTPTANRRDGLQSHGVNAVSGSLNPNWVEVLMGYPVGWTDLPED